MLHVMRQSIAALPMALAGLTLGLASLAQLFRQVGTLPEALSQTLTGLALLLWLLLPLKLLAAPRMFWQQLQDPLAGSVAPTLAMALMILSQSAEGGWQLAGWYGGVSLHLLLLLSFLRARWHGWQLQQMLPSWFVPPVGILVAVVTCPGPSQLALAALLLGFGGLMFLLLLPLMLYRLHRLPTPALPQQSTLAILAAPASLTLVAYLSFSRQSELTPNLIWCAALYLLALLLNLRVWWLLTSLLRAPFHPGFAALTFPLVVSSLASWQWQQVLQTAPDYSALATLASLPGLAGLPELAGGLRLLALAQLVLASGIVSYVTVRLLWRLRLLPAAQRLSTP